MKQLVGLLYISILILILQTANAQQRRFVAEWEPAWGTLIRWPLGIPSDLVVDLAESDSLYVLVESFYQRDQAIDNFTSWGVNMDHCRFIFAANYSHWTRDWGPHYVFNATGIGGIADPVFDGYPWVPGCNPTDAVPIENSNRMGTLGYEEDDAVNIILADSFECPLISLPVYLTGGNIMVDGYGTAISTQQMLDENFPIASEDLFKQIMLDSAGISNYIILDNPEVHGIQHIDCYAKFLDERRILVKQVDTWNPEYDCCEALAETLGNEHNCWGDPYEIIRIYCGAYNGNEVAAYTNSLILNKKVFVPLFSIASDATALQTYEQAMPGYEIIGYPYADWYYYDALHCRTMGIFDRHMLRIEHEPLQGDLSFNGQVQITASIDDRSETGLIEDNQLLHWRETGSTAWNIEQLIQIEENSFYGVISDPIVGQSYDYYLTATDNSGRLGSLPITSPDDYFSFTITDITTTTFNNSSRKGLLKVSPSLFTSNTNISFKTNSSASLQVMNAKGELIRNWRFENPDAEEIQFYWDGKDDTGKICPAGIYFIRLTNNAKSETVKCIKK